MKIFINLDKIHPAFDELISQKLKERNLPSCMGFMVVPLLDKVKDFEDTDILVPKGSIASELVVETDLKDLTEGSDAVIEGKILSIEGFRNIISYKEKRAELYADQCLQCSTCKHFTVCDKLTRNTLLSLVLKDK